MTRVDYELHYEFSNPLYALAASSKFDAVAAKVLKGFEKRCHEVYGCVYTHSWRSLVQG